MFEDDLTPERLKQLEGRWKSDVDLKLDRLVRFADKYEHYLESMVEREKKKIAFWEKMEEHVAKWGMISVVSFAFYALWLGINAVFKLNGIHG